MNERNINGNTILNFKQFWKSFNIKSGLSKKKKKKTQARKLQQRGAGEGAAEHYTANIADIMVVLPSHLLYFPISGKLYLISALPQTLFGRLLK